MNSDNFLTITQQPSSPLNSTSITPLFLLTKVLNVQYGSMIREKATNATLLHIILN